MSQFKSIDALLNKNKKRLITIQENYEECLNQKNISEDLKIEIKEFLEGLRSCLDYVWKLIPNRPKKSGNFPISNSKNHFENATKGIHNELLFILERVNTI